MVDLVLPKEELRSNGLSGKKIEVPFFYIARDCHEFNLHSRVVKNNYSLAFNKHVLKVNEGCKAFPFGYKKAV